MENPENPERSVPGSVCNESSIIHLADDVPHLLSVDDVRGVDDGGVGGPVQLSRVLVPRLQDRKLLVNTNCCCRHRTRLLL